MRRSLVPILLVLGAGCSPTSDAIAIRDARIVAGPASAAAYVELSNHGPADRLVGIDAPALGPASLHQSSLANGIVRMRMLPQGIALGAGSKVVLAPGGLHAMIMAPRAIKAGASTPLVLRFERHPPIRLTVPVTSPADEQARR